MKELIQVGSTVITPHGVAVVEIKTSDAVRVKHMEVITPITDYYLNEIKLWNQ